ncbi:GNAT family N-acetyltransferase [Roseateles violae]|uniref:GNAT family protein n=1 Tax=Roseateles violae TaxID=3058042 RepID=A0ABT8DRV0_9BURK|nr:GNAT family protein [Pelomonas sp. PFR6]MDN3920703.1 GNAT family protein [Pelomonas sp. PFR6]
MSSAEASFPLLTSARLRLRELTPADAPALFAIHGDAEAMRWFGSDPLQSVAEAEKLVETFAGWRCLPNPGTRWGLERIADGALVGSCGLFAWNRAWRRCTLGYELARAAQGQGLMTEALLTVLAWGFSADGMGLNRVEAMIHPKNQASLRLAEGLGFRREGLLREVAFWGGRHEDLEMHALLARDRQPAA